MSFQFDHWELDTFNWRHHSRPQKTVTYSNVCLVILIPTRHEFRDAEIDLWDSNQRFHDNCNRPEDCFADSPIPTEEELKALKEEPTSSSYKDEEEDVDVDGESIRPIRLKQKQYSTPTASDMIAAAAAAAILKESPQTCREL